VPRCGQCDKNEILENLKSQGVTDAVVVTLKPDTPDGERRMTNTVILSFNRPQPLQYITCGYLRVPVATFVPNPLILRKGRLVFRQYLPLKRARFGIKLFCLCEDSGYMYRFRVYSGKQDPVSGIDTALPQECSKLSVSDKVVAYLMLPLLNQGYTV